MDSGNTYKFVLLSPVSITPLLATNTIQTSHGFWMHYTKSHHHHCLFPSYLHWLQRPFKSVSILEALYKFTPSTSPVSITPSLAIKTTQICTYSGSTTQSHTIIIACFNHTFTGYKNRSDLNLFWKHCTKSHHHHRLFPSHLHRL